MTDRTRYIITLHAEPDQVPEIIRVRRALKCLLRSFGLRCTRIEEAHNNEQLPADAGEPYTRPSAGKEQ
jgi:hypothetical protein